MDFDNERWFDYRKVDEIYQDFVPCEVNLPSDSCHRPDLQLLALGDVDRA